MPKLKNRKDLYEHIKYFFTQDIVNGICGICNKSGKIDMHEKKAKLSDESNPRLRRRSETSLSASDRSLIKLSCECIFHEKCFKKWISYIKKPQCAVCQNIELIAYCQDCKDFINHYHF